MIPHITKGGDMHGLVSYLTSTESRTDPRANQHENPRVVGGEPFLATVYGGVDLAGGERDYAQELSDYLDAPRRAYQVKVLTRVYEQDAETGARKVATVDGEPAWKEQNTWHCSLSLADGESLSDERWGQVADEFAGQMGFTGADGKSPVRWVAIHHGEGRGGHDHLHIAASLVREDGTKWNAYRDFPRAQQACRDIEKRHGLTQVQGREFGTATRGLTPVELARQDGAAVQPREELAQRVRAAAVASASEAEWVRRVRADGLAVMPRFAEGTTDVVVGYRAALKGQDQLRFYGGGQLGRDLSLPRLRELWSAPSLEQAGEASDEWQAAFRGRPTGVVGREQRELPTTAPEAARRNLAAYADRLAKVPATDRVAWSVAAREVSGALAAWAQVDQQNGPALRQAAGVISRAAQDRRPSAGPAQRTGQSAVTTSLVFLAAQGGKRPEVAAAALMAQLVQMAAAIRDYHRTTQNLREARAVDVEMRRLAALRWTGYGPEPTDSRKVKALPRKQPRTTQQQAQQGPALALPRELDQHRPQTAVQYNQGREADRDAGR